MQHKADEATLIQFNNVHQQLNEMLWSTIGKPRTERLVLDLSSNLNNFVNEQIKLKTIEIYYDEALTIKHQGEVAFKASFPTPYKLKLTLHKVYKDGTHGLHQLHMKILPKDSI